MICIPDIVICTHIVHGHTGPQSAMLSLNKRMAYRTSHYTSVGNLLWLGFLNWKNWT